MLQCKQCTTRLISSVAKFFRLHCSSVLCDNVNFTEYFSRVPKNPLWVFSGTFKILDDTAGSKNVTTGSNQHHECNMFISLFHFPNTSSWQERRLCVVFKSPWVDALSLFVTAHCVTCPEQPGSTSRMWWRTTNDSKPGREMNLHCCFAVALAVLAFFPLRVRISHKEPQYFPQMHSGRSVGLQLCVAGRGDCYEFFEWASLLKTRAWSGFCRHISVRNTLHWVYCKRSYPAVTYFTRKAKLWEAMYCAITRRGGQCFWSLFCHKPQCSISRNN